MKDTTIAWTTPPGLGPDGTCDKLWLDRNLAISVWYPSPDPHFSVWKLTDNGITVRKADGRFETREDAKRYAVEWALNLLERIRISAQKDEDVVRAARNALYPESCEKKEQT